MSAEQQHPGPWAPPLDGLRLLADGRSVAVLGRDGRILWWCAPDVDTAPLCWQLLDPEGGTAGFDDLDYYDADEGPAGVSATTVLRGDDGLVEVRDALLPDADGVLLVRLLRRRPGAGEAPEGSTTVRHRLRLGGFDAPAVTLAPDGRVATGTHPGSRQSRVFGRVAG